MMSSRRNTDPDADDATLRALLQLRMLPGLPDERLNQLISRYNPKFLLEIASPELLGVRAHNAIRSRAVRDRVEAVLRMIDKGGISVLSIRDDAYPERLRPLGELAPAILFCRGHLELMQSRSIAVIGARDSTEYGDSVAELLATELVQHGVTVISGLARGIDGIAHSAALRAGGNTVAVLGCGIDVFYPPGNARLQERIAEEGLLISEFAPGSPAYRKNFPQRNRIIALLSEGVLVVEAGVKSGTLKTVEWAAQYGVDVFAVPGPIGRYESQGTNELIRDGSHIVLGIRDLLETKNWRACGEADARGGESPNAYEFSDPLTRSIYAKLSTTATHVDAIARKAGLEVREALMHLMELELAGAIVQHPGKRFSRPLAALKRSTTPTS